MKRRRWLLLLACIAAIVAFGLWRRVEKSAPRVRVEAGPIERSVVAAATIRPAGGTTRVRIERTAKVISVDVQLGDRAKRGQRLAEIEYGGLLPEPDARVGLAARPGLPVRPGTGAPASRRQELRAPHAGTLVERRIAVGELVGPHDGALFELADLSALELYVEVDERQAPLMQKGLELQIRPLGGGAELAQGSIARLGPRLQQRSIEGRDPRARAQGLVLPAWVKLDKTGGWLLGQRLEVVIMLSSVQVSARLPHEALTIEDGRAVVRKSSAWFTESTPVTLGISDEHHVQVQDLPPGTEVLLVR